MQVYDAVRTVLAVRAYQEKAIPADTILRILEAGGLTGSSMNRQPWHFIVVENRDTLGKIGKLASSGPYTAQAALAIIVLVERTEYAVSDASRAIQSMILTAWDEGIGSKWVGWLGMNEIKPLLGIPGQLDVLAILPFGYPVQAKGQGKKQRKAISEVVHKERFGQAF